MNVDRGIAQKKKSSSAKKASRNEKKVHVLLRPIPGANQNPLIKTIEKIKIPIPPGGFRMHTTMAFVGSCNSGKTNAMINLAEELQQYGSVNRIFIMSPTYESNAAWQNLKTHPQDVFTGTKVLKQGVECVRVVEETIKKLGKEYKDYEEYVQAYRACQQGTENYRQKSLVKNNGYQEPVFIERPRVLLILDDLSHTEIFSSARSNDFNNMLLRHRHVYDIGLTIMMAVQTFTTGIPKALRQNVKQFFLWRTHDTTQLTSIYEQVAQGCTKDEFFEAFRVATEVDHQFLTVDLNATGSSVFRKNFNEELILQSNSGEEEDEPEYL